MATVEARSNTVAKLFRSDELEKKCNPPEFRTRTSDPVDDPDPTPSEEGGRRCCDAWEFNGAAEGCSSHAGSRADLDEAALPAELLRGLDEVLDDATLSPAELLKPFESQPCLMETRYVTDGPKPFFDPLPETVPTG